MAENYRPWEIRGDWIPAAEAALAAVPGSYGIYEIAGAGGELLYAGYAGGRTLRGLQGCIREHFATPGRLAGVTARAAGFRFEVNSSYLGRWLEVLGRYQEEHGVLPPGNVEEGADLPTLPRFTGGRHGPRG
jgi:hypothetical protein